MGFGEAFKTKQTPVTAEAILLQRKDEIDRHRAAVARVEQEEARARERLGNIQLEIDIAIKERMRAIEFRDASSKKKELEADTRTIEIATQAEEFENYRASRQKELEDLLAQVKAETQKNESILAATRLLQAGYDEAEKRVQDYGLRLAQKEEGLNARADMLEKSAQTANQKLLDAEDKFRRVNEAREELRVESDAIALQRATFAEERRELEMLRRSARESQQNAKNELESLAQEKANILDLQNRNKIQSDALKTTQDELEQRRLQLNIISQNINDKQSALNAREAQLVERERKQGA